MLTATYFTPRTLFLLAGYTDKASLAHSPAGGEGDGVYAVLLDPADEEGPLQLLSSSRLESNPTMILRHHTLDIVYMVTEVINTMSELIMARVNR